MDATDVATMPPEPQMPAVERTKSGDDAELSLPVAAAAEPSEAAPEHEPSPKDAVEHDVEAEDDGEHDAPADAAGVQVDVDLSTPNPDVNEHEDALTPEMDGVVAPVPSAVSVPTTIAYSVNEMEVVTNRGGRSGSLSKFLDDADSFRRRSLPAYPDDTVFGASLQQKRMTLTAFLDMAIDPILEVLEDSDSDVRLWLMQPETVRAVIAEFIKAPVFTGEPHEEYGYYKNYFVCSEIIMKLYTGEEDLYESFSSDSSSGSATITAVFGCVEPEDIAHWEHLYSIFKREAPLDEMQMLFFSKALVRLHDGFCLEDGYVPNVLQRFLPLVVPHLYSNTVKYMLTLILQSYESVHPITGRNDAMEIIAPLLIGATKTDIVDEMNIQLVENTSHLLVDILRANQADRLGAFCRREGGVYLSKYFVRDQFGTIRGFESMTHGYHNFMQFMFLEEMGKKPEVMEELFQNAVQELVETKARQVTELSSALAIHAATELLSLCQKHKKSADEDNQFDDQNSPTNEGPDSQMEHFPGSPRGGGEAVMYSFNSLSRKQELWSGVVTAATKTAKEVVGLFNEGLPSSMEISIAKHLHALVSLNDEKVNEALHQGGLIPRYFQVMQARPKFDMLLIHIIPALVFILRDEDQKRSKNCPLTKDMFVPENGGQSLLDLIVSAKEQIPALYIHVKILEETIEELLSTKTHTQNNMQVTYYCRRNSFWSRLNGLRSSLRDRRRSSCESARLSERRSSQKENDDANGDVPPPPEQRNSAHGGENDNQATGDGETSRKSGHYLKQVLQSPVFKNTRLGAVMKGPEKVTSPKSQPEQQSQQGQRNSFGWNTMLKKLRKSLVTTTTNTPTDKKLLALTNEPYQHSLSSSQSEVVVVDTSKGDDVTTFVHHDGGVHVSDVPTLSPGGHAHGDKAMNVLTCGYMYKNRMPETGQRHVWERYYFVLNRTEGLLSYYVSEAHAKDKTYVRGSVRPQSVTEGIPVTVTGNHNVYGLQVNTQGHGAFILLVDSIDARLVWLTEILACVNTSSTHGGHAGSKRASLIGDRGDAMTAPTPMSKQEMKELVKDFYKNLFGPSLRFSTPIEAPASFWMEEKIDPVDESCVLSSNLPNCVPYWGEFHGYQRMCDFWKTRDETIEKSSGRVLRIVVDEEEETAVVMTSTTFRILRNSEVVTEETCDLVSISGGKIVSIHCTFDSFRIAEAFQKHIEREDRDTMSELQLIVEHLNKEPFRLGLTLVAFDEKSNFELLQILNEVFTEIDQKHNVDLRNEADEQRAFRYLEFLQLLKFPLPRDMDSFRDALIHGERQVIYPILHWALKSMPGHKKRAYLGRFLAPLSVPQEYFGNETLNNMYEHYKQLQEQFKAVHKEIDQLRNSKTRPGELRKEISQLEEESHQLQEKIANLKKKTQSESGFKDILEATSALRKEQEEQAKLAERKRDQMMSLSLVEKRSRECEQRLMDLRASLSHDTPPDQLFDHLKTQVERNQDILMTKFPQEFKVQQENLQRLERALSEPPKTEADIADMEDELSSLKKSIQQFQAQIAEAQKNAGDDKLAIFRQHANVQAKKVSDKEEEIENLRSEKVKMQKQIEELEAKMSELTGSKFMSREEFKQYANTLRNKTNQYKKVKAEVAEITAESVVLHRTEQLLKSKDADLDGFLKDLEAKKGVTGFLDTQEKLDNISEMNAQINKMKGETLEEISRIVTDINQTLKERKNQLAPQIKELRAVRQKYQEMEQTYLEKKAQYDNTAVGLETERIKLEQECHAFQEDCLREESQYHYLHCMLQMEKGKIEKIEQEMEFEKGNGRLLRDIKSFQELYKHKVAQQESLTKELRKQQKTLKSNTAEHNAQREMFENLYKLLQCKVKLAGKTNAGSGKGQEGLFDGGADIAQFDVVGGANVMTLDS
ncbi:TPA: hypothetical protein N0F65_003641 [Lagenidium giganteum]|uniref:PH domain-containing protein n=1 Tax=Lagenidium giganteum TaxID=4803 RepID=A0AAV2YJ24_9STRA|nr:TPA: hypothetical protein N0F65_003641 [Lagenidium giganteum]